MLNRWKIDISSPKLLSTMATTKDKTHSERDTPSPEKKPLVVVVYNKQANKDKIKSLTPENVEECLGNMCLDFSK